MTRGQHKRFTTITSILFFTTWSCLFCQDPSQLPLISVLDMTYEGAFRMPAWDIGSSSLNYSEGPIAFNPDSHSLFIVGHSHHQAIGEFYVPQIIQSDSLEELEMADSVIQVFTSILDEASNGNPQGLNRIGGMTYTQTNSGSQLVVNAYEYYDAPGDNTETTVIIRNSNDLDGAHKEGYMSYAGGAGHTSGWLSPIPHVWQEALRGNYITGQSSGIPIISRTSVGPSAFSFYIEDILEASPAIISTTSLMDFSLANPLHDDLSNSTLANDLWTHLSRVTYGFIIPGTRTYMTLGWSGGHESGVCYKCTQNNGNLCGGYCSYDSEDNYQFYWLWDVNDFVEVINGSKLAYELRPYEYGEFFSPYQNSTEEIGGASWDPINGRLFLSIQKADREQGTFANPPVIISYKFNTMSDINMVLTTSFIELKPNFTPFDYGLSGELDEYTIEILYEDETQFQVLNPSGQELDIELSDLPEGKYFLLVRHLTEPKLSFQNVLKED